MPANIQRHRLCQTQVRRLLDSDKWSEIWDAELTGFHIRKTSKSASYRLSYRHPTTRKCHVMTLGRADQISLLEAREAAARTVSMLASQAMNHKVDTVLNQ
ncbi:DUF4102 domain-containing protein [Halomonas sp. TRM85114]|uniref:Arm DNA-binding domain-containing protein n=1 Tax=Halomonas jincaotanensis TaxID=2810616 RepID=UPI001BD1CBFA|nr:DUF4102 domain-containing protein [Halomonas jincaotanensis]